MRSAFVLALVVVLSIACGGGQGANAPGQSPCEHSCMSQENACQAGCMNAKSTFQNSCDSHCGDDNARCMAGC
jgi:hypothetical protein